MEKGFISPLNDYVVKSIYGDQKNIGNTERLLKPVLGIPPEEYDKLTTVDPFLKRRWQKDKQGILDIRLTTKTGRSVDVEVQIRYYKAMLQRIIYYQAKMVTEQMKSGFDYNQIRQTISVVITDHILLPDEAGRRYMNTFELRNRQTGNLFTDLQRIIILELPKVPEEDDGEAIWPHLRFFKCRTEEELDMLLKRHPEVESVVSDQRSAEYHHISWSERRRRRAEYKERERRDEWALIEGAKDQGREQGRAESQKVIEAQARELTEKDRALEAQSREIAELRQKLRDLGGL
jgi:predicted transposase/invertase (TIGR01784 family)